MPRFAISYSKVLLPLFTILGMNPHSSGVEVGPDTDQVFLDLWVDAAPAAERAVRRDLARSEFTHWRRYVALVDGQAVAHAAMFVSTENRAGVLAAAELIPGVNRAEVEDETLRVFTARADVVPVLLRTSLNAGLFVLDVSVRRPSLETVFLTLTGREYRE